MIKILSVLIMLLLLLALNALPVIAVPNSSVTLPTRPAEKSALVELKEVTINGRKAKGLAHIRYKDSTSLTETLLTKQAAPASTAVCYAYVEGVRWKTLEPWIMNPSNTQGLLQTSVFTNMSRNMAKWENAADGKVDSKLQDILGNGRITNELLAVDTEYPDGRNEVYFGTVADPNMIALTIIWAYFDGPVENREIIEWDMVFNQGNYAWTMAQRIRDGKMDFESISTHELGHAFGLHDLYTYECRNATMYGIIDGGETLKRTLDGADVTGISSLY